MKWAGAGVSAERFGRPPALGARARPQYTIKGEARGESIRFPGLVRGSRRASRHSAETIVLPLTRAAGRLFYAAAAPILSGGVILTPIQRAARTHSKAPSRRARNETGASFFWSGWGRLSA